MVVVGTVQERSAAAGSEGAPPRIARGALKTEMRTRVVFSQKNTRVTQPGVSSTPGHGHVRLSTRGLTVMSIRGFAAVGLQRTIL